MSTGEGNICRLCFRPAEVQCEVIDDLMKMTLDVLLLQMNWNVGKNFICQQCVEKAESFFYFKSTCIDTEQRILFSAVDKKKKEIEMDVSAGNRSLEMAVHDELSVCRFCMTWLDRNDCVPIELLLGRSIIVEMLPVFMPELDIGVVKYPLTCIPCAEKLESYFRFVLNCLDVKEKINKQDQGKEIIGLSEQNVGDLLKYTHSREIKQELDEFDDVYIKKFKVRRVEEAIIKDESVDKIYICPVCPYETRRKGYLKKHEFFHENISEVQVYKCTVCPFETAHKFALKRHLVIHKNTSERDIYNCTFCAFRTIHKAVLKMHVLKHKSLSELEMYKCTVCMYETRYKYNLKKHKLIHNDVSDVEIHKHALDLEKFKCVFCNYETIHKSNYKRHMVTHKDILDMEVYKCALCTYETVDKYALKRHILTRIHKESSVRERYKCTICTFETWYKRSLKRHVDIHMEVSEQQIYKCTLCTYNTKDKGNFRKHTDITHKDTSEVQMFKCTKCTYETKWKSSLKRHIMLQHKDY